MSSEKWWGELDPTLVMVATGRRSLEHRKTKAGALGESIFVWQLMGKRELLKLQKQAEAAGEGGVGGLGCAGRCV